MTSEIFSGHTLTKVRNLIKRGVDTQVLYRDAGTTGLAIKITKTTASWYYSTRNANLLIAPFTSFGLDDLPRLRELVVTLNQEAKRGHDLGTLIKSFAAGHSVMNAKHLHDVDIGEGITWEVGRDFFLEWCKLNRNKDTARGYRSALGATAGLHDDFAPIHGMPIAAITSYDLAQIRRNIVQRGREGRAKGQGIRQGDLTVAAIKSAFKYFLVELGLKITNPAAGLTKGMSRAVVSHTLDTVRSLTQLEVGALWFALEACPNEQARLALKLQLLTGQRRMTATSALKDAFQVDGPAYACVWSLEDKVHHWRKFPLPSEATAVVRQALRLSASNTDSRYLFPKQRAKKKGDAMDGHINERTVSVVVESLRQPGGIFEMMPFPVSTHDLRKAFTSTMRPKMGQFMQVGRKMEPKEIEIITHKNEGRESVSELVYDRNVYLDTKMEILTVWQDYVLEGYRLYCEQFSMKKAA